MASPSSEIATLLSVSSAKLSGWWAQRTRKTQRGHRHERLV